MIYEIKRIDSQYGKMKYLLTVDNGNGKARYWYKTEKEAQYKKEQLIKTENDNKFFINPMNK